MNLTTDGNTTKFKTDRIDVTETPERIRIYVGCFEVDICDGEISIDHRKLSGKIKTEWAGSAIVISEVK